MVLTLGFLGCISAQTPRIVDDGSLLLPINPEQVTNATDTAYTVTLNFEFDTKQFRAPSIAYLFDIETNNAIPATNNGQGGLRGQVRQGVYDIVAYFRDKNNYSQYIIIFEQCHISQDITLTLNPENCTNHISTRNYGPNGDLLKLNLGHVDWENYSIVTDEYGDIESMGVTNIIYRKGTGGLMSYSVTFGGTVIDEESRNCPLDIHVNDVSNRFVFIQERIGYTNDLSKSYCSWVSTDNCKTDLLENNPNDYIQQTYTFKYRPSTRSQNGYGIENVLWRIDDHGPSQTGEARRINDNKQDNLLTHEVWSTIPSTDPYIPELNIVLQTNFLENSDDACTLGPCLRVLNGQKEFVNLGHHGYGDFGIITNELYAIDDNMYQLLTNSSILSYPTECVDGIINDCCPINTLQVKTYNNDAENYLGLTNYFVGRYGEVRCKEDVDVKAMFNGTEIDLSSFIPDEKGCYEFTVTNNNIEVDGLSGINTSTVYFEQDQEDSTPPSIEMLHFKNSAGDITDRFANAQDGTMEFYASDFHYRYYPEMWNGVFECQPVEVSVEYAPYGTEEWNELSVEEIPEYYQEPGWGYFFRASLADVEGTAEKGWFDLRFRLQDASGNWMDQVVSPAFRIDDLAYTSVANIGGDNAREVARYSIDGKRVDASHHGVTIVKMSDGTAKKIVQ